MGSGYVYIPSEDIGNGSRSFRRKVWPRLYKNTFTVTSGEKDIFGKMPPEFPVHIKASGHFVFMETDWNPGVNFPLWLL